MWSKSQNCRLRHYFRKYWLWSCVNVAWRNMSEEVPNSSVDCNTQRPSASPQKRKTPLPGQTHWHTQMHAHTDLNATPHMRKQSRLKHTLACLFLSSCLSLTNTHHGHLGTEVSYLKAKSNYGFQIPLCKRFHVSIHRLCMYFLIQDKSSRSVRCILSLPEGCLNRCAVCIKQFYLAGFHNVLQHNVFPKSIIADNVKLYTSNEYMHTANGMKSSNCMKIFDSTLCWLKWVGKEKVDAEITIPISFGTLLQLRCVLMKNATLHSILARECSQLKHNSYKVCDSS